MDAVSQHAAAVHSSLLLSCMTSYRTYSHVGVSCVLQHALAIDNKARTEDMPAAQPAMRGSQMHTRCRMAQ